MLIARSCLSELPLPLARLGLPRGHVKARRLHRCRPPERPMRAQVLEYLQRGCGGGAEAAEAVQRPRAAQRWRRDGAEAVQRRCRGSGAPMRRSRQARSAAGSLRAAAPRAARPSPVVAPQAHALSPPAAAAAAAAAAGVAAGVAVGVAADVASILPPGPAGAGECGGAAGQRASHLPPRPPAAVAAWR